MQAVLLQAGGHAQLQPSVRGRLQQPTIVELQRPRLHRNARTSYATFPVSRIFHARGDNPFFSLSPRARNIRLARETNATSQETGKIMSIIMS